MEIARNYLRVAAIVLLLLGATLILLPRFLMDRLSIDYSPAGALFMQFLGASLSAHAYLNWHTRDWQPEVIKAVFKMNIVALGLAVAIGLANLVFNGLTLTGLLIILMHTAFLTGFAVLLKRL
jgi:hypothetical protein